MSNEDRQPEEQQRHCDDQRRLHDIREENRMRFATPEFPMPTESTSLTRHPFMNKLTEIDVRNFKRIRKAHLSLEGHTFVISGDNGEGKSSFLDAIAALFGGKDKSPQVPVRKGAKEATIVGRLKAKDGRVFVATVTFTTQGIRRLAVENEKGELQASPQALLAAFWAETSFDPSLFLTSEGKDQVAMLKGLMHLDFTALDAEKTTKFNERTVINRDLERVKALAASLPQFPDAPAAEVSSAEVLAEIERAHAHNQNVQALSMAVSGAQENLRAYESDMTDSQNEVARLKAELAEAEADVAGGEKAVEARKQAVEAATTKANAVKPVDVQPLKTKLAGLEDSNRKVRANIQKADADKALREKQAAVDKLTDRLDEIDSTKEEMLQKAPFPIDGMSLNENGVILNGLPLEQASDSEKIAIGVEMAAILNPEKPLMLVRHGNLFTPKNFQILDKIAEKRGLTCIVEVAGEQRADTSLLFVDGVGTEPGAAANNEPNLNLS